MVIQYLELFEKEKLRDLPRMGPHCTNLVFSQKDCRSFGYNSRHPRSSILMVCNLY